MRRDAANPGEYLAGLEGWQSAKVECLRRLVLASAPRVAETVRSGILYYDDGAISSRSPPRSGTCRSTCSHRGSCRPTTGGSRAANETSDRSSPRWVWMWTRVGSRDRSIRVGRASQPLPQLRPAAVLPAGLPVLEMYHETTIDVANSLNHTDIYLPVVPSLPIRAA